MLQADQVPQLELDHQRMMAMMPITVLDRMAAAAASVSLSLMADQVRRSPEAVAKFSEQVLWLALVHVCFTDQVARRRDAGQPTTEEEVDQLHVGGLEF